MSDRNERPAFEVRVGDKVYLIWASGRTEGFADGDKAIILFNRIPFLICEAAAEARIIEEKAA